MIVSWILDPTPVWGEIRNYLVDDNNELVTFGPFIGIFEDDKMAGAFLIRKLNEHCFDIHGGIHPDFFGRGVEICDLMGRALFSNTPCLKIIAVIPEFNKLMRRCVQLTGMKQEGIIKKSFLKWMRLHDQYLYGICKSDVVLSTREIKLWHPQQQQ